jgi:hypothetical protein
MRKIKVTKFELRVKENEVRFLCNMFTIYIEHFITQDLLVCEKFYPLDPDDLDDDRNSYKYLEDITLSETLTGEVFLSFSFDPFKMHGRIYEEFDSIKFHNSKFTLFDEDTDIFDQHIELCKKILSIFKKNNHQDRMNLNIKKSL